MRQRTSERMNGITSYLRNTEAGAVTRLFRHGDLANPAATVLQLVGTSASKDFLM